MLRFRKLLEKSCRDKPAGATSTPNTGAAIIEISTLRIRSTDTCRLVASPGGGTTVCKPISTRLMRRNSKPLVYHRLYSGIDLVSLYLWTEDRNLGCILIKQMIPTLIPAEDNSSWESFTGNPTHVKIEVGNKRFTSPTLS